MTTQMVTYTVRRRFAVILEDVIEVSLPENLPEADAAEELINSYDTFFIAALDDTDPSVCMGSQDQFYADVNSIDDEFVVELASDEEIAAMTAARVTKKDVEAVVRSYHETMTRIGLVSGTFILESDSFNGYRLWQDQRGVSPRIGGSYLGRTAREAHAEVCHRLAIAVDVHNIITSQPGADPAPVVKRVFALECAKMAGCTGTRPVTWIDSKGYTYCESCGIRRRSTGYSARELTNTELAKLHAGGTISYENKEY
jgi:hypothetical protein